ncbi:Hypothetical predicted protein [Octopus vulgaris]|uniref:Uncharacterized protein n=1 Tax=Octopus vulgaris TaxID=6645 RepID=A0AA36BTL3_OCTVU|nr:Hypothetical predicted protein [Octopus vulgaris]
MYKNRRKMRGNGETSKVEELTHAGDNDDHDADGDGYAMAGIKSKYQNKLQLSNSLRLKLSRIEPDVNSIIERSKKQAHPSHRPH